MSELMNGNATQMTFRRHMLTTASVLALVASTCGIRDADAAGEDHPSYWIELGGQFDDVDAAQSSWVLPPSFAPVPSPPLDHPAPTSLGTTPHVGFDVDGKISFEPDGSDWILSASVRYGRAARGPITTRDQSYNTAGAKYGYPTTNAFVAARTEATERHLILDFQAGKDLGLGMGRNSTSVVNFGVRIAQFNSRLNVHVNSRHPSVVPTPSGGNGGGYGGAPGTAQPVGDADMRHSFTGFGPSISWDASIPVLGPPRNGLSFDWNANGAILFGRQKTVAHIVTKDVQYFYSLAGYRACNCETGALQTRVLSQTDATIVRSRQVIVPNVGGLLGISYRRSNAKITLGYRADFFFGAIDGGVDSRKTYNRGFYGPFANISIGIGG